MQTDKSTAYDDDATNDTSDEVHLPARSRRFGYRKRPLPPIQELVDEARRVYGYSDEHRGLVWKAHKNPLRPWPALGTVVGGDDGHGYRMCLLLGHKFKVHQVVWMMHEGEFPAKALDHANSDRRDNRIGNLRLAEDIQNAQNRSDLTERGPTTGVRRLPNGKRRPFAAIIQHLGKKVYLGSFPTVEEAHAAYVKAKRRICGDFSPFAESPL